MVVCSWSVLRLRNVWKTGICNIKGFHDERVMVGKLGFVS